MSTRTTNCNNNHVNQPHQQEIPTQHSNSVNSPQMTLTRSDSTSTVIFEEETRPCRRNGAQLLSPTTLLTNRSASLRSLLKTSGLFNKDMESSDKFDELFASGNGFALHRLLSDMGASGDCNIDLNELLKFEPMKVLDPRSLSELLQSDSFVDQLMASSAPITDLPATIAPPTTVGCSSASFSELRPVSPELMTDDVFRAPCNQFKTEPDHPMSYAQLNSFENSISPAPVVPGQFNFDPCALAAFEHDHAFLSKRTTAINMPISAPATSKRTRPPPRRASARLHSIASSIGSNSILNDDSCSSSSALLTPASACESRSTSSLRTKRSRIVNRAVDIKTSDDLSYYLERRRKNNEASKMSRAARKQKFGDMDSRCAEYERVNANLRQKISTLETVNASLRSGLIHSFQTKPKF
jgi:hypothetical protein